MKTQFNRSFFGPVLVLAAIVSVACGQVTGSNAPKAGVSMKASVEAVVPGRPFDAALHFQLPEDWHIFWPGSGDAGLPPAVTWKLPDGFSVGELRFPMPVEYVDPANRRTNILEGEPILLVEITPPAAIADQRVVLEALVHYQMFKEDYVAAKDQVRLELPVAPDGSEVRSANEELFETARQAMPKSRSRYVTVTPAAGATSFKPGETFDLELAIKIARGNHIQSNKPLNRNFIASELLLKRTAGLEFGEPVFPAAHVRRVQYLGRVSEFSGTIKVRVPVTVQEEAPATPVRLRGLFTFQACNDKGTCFPPETIAFGLTIGQVGPASSVAVTESAVPPVAASSGAGENPDEPRAPKAQAAPSPATTSTLSTPPVEASESDSGGSWLKPPETLAGWVFWALIGGLILNIMPCVLPVISIKILSFVQQADEHPRRVFALGLAFAAGVLVSFEALAVLVVALKAAGTSLGWGFQFTSPTVVIVLTGVIFAFGLSLFGVFDITLPGATVTSLSAAEEREGLLGAFMKGVLATVLATPCSAPLLGPALGFAFATSTTKLIVIFTAVGVGMAFPYVLLTAFPAWLRYLPRPGAWMEHFKQFMGFILMGTVVFLLVILGDLVGAGGVAWCIGFLCFVAFGAWLLGKQTPSTPVGWRLTTWTTAIALVVIGWWVSFTRASTIDVGLERERLVAKAFEIIERSGGFDQVMLDLDRASRAEREKWAKLDYSEQLPWQLWWKGRPQDLARKGYTVYVDYTATWCPTCQANKKATVESKKVRKKMKELRVIPIKGDFTSGDPAILEALEAFGASAVPLNVIYPAGKPNKPIVLPIQLVGRIPLVIEKLEEAGPSRPDKG